MTTLPLHSEHIEEYYRHEMERDFAEMESSFPYINQESYRNGEYPWAEPPNSIDQHESTEWLNPTNSQQ